MFPSIITLLLLCGPLILVNVKAMYSKEYTIDENKLPKFFIGNIKEVFDNYQYPSLTDFRILNEDDQASFFTIDNETGDLKVAKLIDRERICPPKPSSPLTNSNFDICSVKLQIWSGTGSGKSVDISINIRDQNDNKPSWRDKSIIEVKFLDGAEIGTRHELPGATDPDAGDNGAIEYKLVSSKPPYNPSQSNLMLDQRFVLQQNHNDGEGLFIQAIRPIDREEQSNYSMTLLAIDKGRPHRQTGSITLNITIEDINDNTPTFTKTKFEPPGPIPETTRVGTLILNLTATDADAGENGRFEFNFSPLDKSPAKKYFQITPRGSIVVKRPLDYDSGDNIFDFKVVVKDKAMPPYTRSSTATVHIVISDENDEKPIIQVRCPNADPADTPIVRENQQSNAIVAFVKVVDMDYGSKDAVNCEINNKNFSLFLIKHQPNEYELKTATQFDRETTPRQHLTITCSDSVNLTTKYEMLIKIADENDNPPIFSENIFILKLAEHEPAGSTLSKRVMAYDLDEGKNGEVEYVIGPSSALNFTINSHGVISARVSFDRELSSKYTIEVLAIDRGEPRLTATGTVQLEITDINDHDPIFLQTSYIFTVAEGQPRSTQVGKVTATDPDKKDPEINRDFNRPTTEIIYSIEQDPMYRHGAPGENLRSHKAFQINPTTGLITVNDRLDRETQSQYGFRVVAKDMVSGILSRSSTVSVTVNVLDINDNSPVFIVPNITHNSFQVEASRTTGNTIATIKAIDADNEQNSEVVYTMEGADLFRLDETSGILLLNKAIPINAEPFYLITLIACDKGSPPKCTKFRNTRIVLVGKPTSQSPYPGGYETIKNGSNESVIICLSIIFLILVMATIVLIVLIRRKVYWLGGNRNRKRDVSGPTMVVKSAETDTMKDRKTYDRKCDEDEYLRLKSDRPTTTLDNRKRRKRNNMNDFASEYQTLDGLCLASTMNPRLAQGHHGGNIAMTIGEGGTFHYANCEPPHGAGSAGLHTYYEINPGQLIPACPEFQGMGTLQDHHHMGIHHPQLTNTRASEGSLTCPSNRKLTFQESLDSVKDNNSGKEGSPSFGGPRQFSRSPKYTYAAYSEASFV